MPLLNRAFNFFKSDVSYNFPVVTILLFLRNCKNKVKLSRFFVIICTKFVIIVTLIISVSIFLSCKYGLIYVLRNVNVLLITFKTVTFLFVTAIILNELF